MGEENSSPHHSVGLLLKVFKRGGRDYELVKSESFTYYIKFRNVDQYEMKKIFRTLVHQS